MRRHGFQVVAVTCAGATPIGHANHHDRPPFGGDAPAGWRATRPGHTLLQNHRP